VRKLFVIAAVGVSLLSPGKQAFGDDKVHPPAEMKSPISKGKSAVSKPAAPKAGAAGHHKSASTQIERASTIWEKSWEKDVCVTVLGRDYCETVKVSVEILLRSERLYIRGRLMNGDRTLASFEHALTETCFEALRYGILSAEICVTDVDMDGDRLESVTLTVKGCAGIETPVGTYERCKTLYEGTVRFLAYSAEPTGGDDGIPNYVVSEGDDAPSQTVK
jgi:hypothetical protein